ncbi:MAG: DUF3105 domain-containing protein [Patescibacteria group bacterium]
MSKSLWALVIVVLILIGWGGSVLVKEKKPVGQDFSVFYLAQNREHIAVGVEHPPYNSNPPSGGWHYALTAKKKFYDEPVLDGYVVHNLEHGDVWIAYHPRISEEAKNALKRFEFSKIIISPREANDTDIALVAWERVDKFNLDGGAVPESRLRDFIKRHRNKGPESIPAGAHEATFN